jgi:lambda repressor-like predicted transcriptional regulator
MLPQRKEHPFKSILKKNQIRLWQLSQITGYSPASLSDFLNNGRPMPETVAEAIQRVIAEVQHAEA